MKRIAQRHWWTGLRILTLLLAVVSVTACQTTRQTYDGPARPANEIATLRPNPTIARIAFVVESVDGAEVNAREDLVTMLRGERTLELVVTPIPVSEWRTIPAGPHGRLANELDRRERRWATVTFRAEAGRFYALDGARTADGVIEGAWVVDLADGSIVAQADLSRMIRD